jgi:hypothetical protein
VSGDVQVKLRGQVLRLNPRRRVVTVGLPSVGRGRSFRADYAMPGEALARAVEFGYGGAGRVVGVVVAVRPTGCVPPVVLARRAGHPGHVYALLPIVWPARMGVVTNSPTVHS